MTHTLLFVTGDLDLGGTERHLVQVLPRLSRARYRVLVYTLSHKGALAPELEDAGIPVTEPPLSGFLRRRLGRRARRSLLLAISLARLIVLMLRERPAVVHMFLSEAYLMGGLCAIATRCRVRAMSRRSLNDYLGKRPFAARLERWLHRRTHAVLGNSAAVARELRGEGVAPDRLGVIHNGVDPAPYAGGGGAARGALGIAADALVLVVVANLIAYKGHADLLDALGAIRGDLPDGWRLVCVGRDEGLGAGLAARARGLGIDGNVRFVGERADVPALLLGADIGVLCSHEEGFANAVLEGMAAGLPMVVTGVGGNPEAVVDGVTGLVVPARDPRALGRAVLALARDPARRAAMGEAGRRRAEDSFSVDSCVDRYERLYAALTAGDRRPVPEVLDGA